AEDERTLQLTQIYEWTPLHGGPLGRVVQVDLLHLVSADRLGELARASGFGVVRLWGDHRSIPYGATSRRVIIEARLV
ncbi:MAG: hypothetical protein PVG27_01675, partial [Chloroflexota bacterium]